MSPRENEGIHEDGDALQNAKIVIDGSGDREFRRNLAAALRRRMKDGVVKDVRFKDSDADPLIQLADMCVGAIARSYRNDRATPCRWREKLRPRIEDVWNFR